MLKKILLGTMVLFFCSNIFAWVKDFPQNYTPGFYIGAGAGWANADSGAGLRDALTYLYNVDSVSFANKDIDEGGWVGGRGYIGYSFNPYVGVEAGFTYFPSNKYIGTGSGPINYTFNLRQRTYAIDMVGKLTLPLGKLDCILANWSVFGRAGGAYVNNEFSGSIIINGMNQQNTNAREKIRPTFGLGISYDITNNIGIDASWMTIISNDRLNTAEVLSGQYHTPVPNCNLYAVGLSYKFTNLL